MRNIVKVIWVSALVWAAPVVAESPQAFPEFTFKRVKPPKPGSGKRITVQIDPADQAHLQPRPKSEKDVEVASAEPGVAGAVAPVGSYAWFWQGISPLMIDSAPGRLMPALQRLANPPNGAGVRAPRLAQLQDIAQAQGSQILLYTVGTNVSPALVLAVIAVESGGRIDAVSGAGAGGLMQLMPATAERFGVNDRMIAAQNIKGGIAYLDWLLKEFDGDPILALAGYNAGENAVKKHEGVPPYAETRDYVPKVLAAFSVARGLCLTPPEFVSDGCVFVKKG